MAIKEKESGSCRDMVNIHLWDHHFLSPTVCSGAECNRGGGAQGSTEATARSETQIMTKEVSFGGGTRFDVLDGTVRRAARCCRLMSRREQECSGHSAQ